MSCLIDPTPNTDGTHSILPCFTLGTLVIRGTYAQVAKELGWRELHRPSCRYAQTEKA
jgi:hypothetical protein